MTTETKKYALNQGTEQVFLSLEELQQLHQQAVEGFAEMERLWNEHAELAKTPKVDKDGRVTTPTLSFHQWNSKYARSAGQSEINVSTSTSWPQSSYGYVNGRTPSTTAAQNALLAAEKQRDDGKAEVARLLQKNVEFLKRIVKDRLRPQDGLYYIEMRGSTRLLCSVYRNMKATCEKCDQQVNPEQLSYHKKTVRCKEQATMKEIRERGMQFCADPRIIKAVKTGIIVGELVPTKYDIYIPVWVVEAAATFDKQGGYAGLDFQDYLARLAPEKEKL